MTTTPPSPGSLIQASMDQKGWSQSDLAFALGTTTAAVSQILSDKRGISPNMAKALAAVFGQPAEVFATAQVVWDVQRAEEPDAAITARARILSRYPLRDMIKRGWIDPEHPTQAVEKQICRFFKVETLDEVPHLAHAAKKTRYDEVPPPQLAWLFRVRQIAEEMHCPAFDNLRLQDAIRQFADLRIEPEAVRHVPQLLHAAGVRLVVVEALPNSKIDGVCLWLNETSPVIGLSIRYDRIDSFWFVLRHECAHVFHGHGKDAAIVDSDLEGDQPQGGAEEEAIANREAADFCVPSEKMRSFIERKRPFFAERDVLAFAKIQKVHPGLVVGQIQRAMNRYDLLRKHLVKIRKPLAMSMMMDGWGDMVPTER